MQNPNISTGVYEQIINRLFKLKLDEVDADSLASEYHNI